MELLTLTLAVAALAISLYNTILLGTIAEDTMVEEE